LTNNFQIRSFDVSLFLQGSVGAEIYNFMKWQLERMNTPTYNQSVGVTDRYTAENTDGALPRFTTTNTNNTAMSDRYVENGSYMRIQNLTLGYTLPNRISSKAYISNLRVWVSAQNLYTFRIRL
jgi:hypothetical protein